MGIFINTPKSSGGDLELIASGSGSLAAGIVITKVGQFLKPAMTLQQKLILSLDAIAADPADLITAAASLIENDVSPDNPIYCSGSVNHAIVKDEIQRSPANSGLLDLIRVGNQGFVTQNDLNIWGDMTTADMIYINIQAVGSIINFSWTAFMQG